jgi:anti-sigma B factor antagonist
LSLTVDVEQNGGDVSVFVRGQIDIDTENLLHNRLVEASLGGRRNLLVDLDGVDFIDSTGLSVLVVALTTARQHDTKLQLAITKERLLKLFRITGLSAVFDIVGPADQAHRN